MLTRLPGFPKQTLKPGQDAAPYGWMMRPEQKGQMSETRHEVAQEWKGTTNPKKKDN
jgi:hypothetical protein